MEEEIDWVAVALRKEGAPSPPDVTSDRIKELIRRGLLEPGSLSAVEVQELAASLLRHLVALRAGKAHPA